MRTAISPPDLTAVQAGRAAKRVYTTRLQKGGAQFSEMRRLVQEWDGRPDCAERLIRQNVLSSSSRLRARDTVMRVFVPRFVRSQPPNLWRPLAILEKAGWRPDQLLPLHYYAAAAAEPLLWDFVTEVLWPKHERGQQEVGTNDVRRFLESAPASRFSGERRWSPPLRERAARSVLTALRDFGVLSGAVKKSIASSLLPTEAFAFIAMIRHLLRVRAEAALSDSCWHLFHLSDTAVERFFIEAHQRKLLEYHAAGSVVRIEFPAETLDEYAHVLAQRAN